MFIGSFRHKDMPAGNARKVENPRNAPANSF
jgi:hypothetical protein